MSKSTVWLRVLVPLILLALLAAAPVGAREQTEPRATIFLDPGHGGPDPGAVYHGAGFTVKEAEVNLNVALMTAARLRAMGFAVSLSRETDD
jgi:N-acetylmuramoyl-L-alanine amidase